MTVNHSRYMNKIRQLLLGAGRRGISQYELNQKTRTKILALDDLIQILNEWEAKQWVQTFQIRVNGTKKTKMWRATTELVAGFQNVHLRGITPKSEFVDLPPSSSDSPEESPSVSSKISAFQYRK